MLGKPNFQICVVLHRTDEFSQKTKNIFQTKRIDATKNFRTSSLKTKLLVNLCKYVTFHISRLIMSCRSCTSDALQFKFIINYSPKILQQLFKSFCFKSTIDLTWTQSIEKVINYKQWLSSIKIFTLRTKVHSNLPKSENKIWKRFLKYSESYDFFSFAFSILILKDLNNNCIVQIFTWNIFNYFFFSVNSSVPSF